MVSKQVKITVAVLALVDQRKAQLPAIRITEQPMMLAKRKINRPDYKFSEYKIGQSNVVLVLIFVLESKSP